MSKNLLWYSVVLISGLVLTACHDPTSGSDILEPTDPLEIIINHQSSIISEFFY